MSAACLREITGERLNFSMLSASIGRCLTLTVWGSGSRFRLTPSKGILVQLHSMPLKTLISVPNWLFFFFNWPQTHPFSRCVKLLTSFVNLPASTVVGWLFCPSGVFASTLTPSEDLNTGIIFILRPLLVLSSREKRATMNELFYHRRKRSECYSEFLG